MALARRGYFAALNPIITHRTTRFFLLVSGFIGAAFFMGLGAAWSWSTMIDVPAGRTDLCVELIVAGLGIAAALGGAMYLLEQPLLRAAPPRWHIRFPIKFVRRILLLGQMVAMLPVVAATMVLLYGDPLIDWVTKHLAHASGGS